MLAAAVVFFASLGGIALLFSLKAVEAKRGHVYAQNIRSLADSYALALKRQLFQLKVILARVPPLLVLLGRYALHELALAAAKVARLAETQAHRIADLVSHKRSFEKRPAPPEPRSDFLKQVSEVKNGHAQDESKEI